jgi:hypothetical protein
MKKIHFLPLFAAILCACSPKVGTTLTASRPAVDTNAPVAVIGVADPLPEGAEVLGTFKVGDSGFSVDCGYEKAIELAKKQARAAGGNVVKLTEHIPPSAFGNSCHRIKGTIAYESDPGNFRHALGETDQQVDSALYAQNSAAVHFYRFSGPGAMVGYDIKANDEVLCRMKSNYRDSFVLRAPGVVVISATTESRTELTLDLQPGYHYYVRCGMAMGVMVGRPTLTQVDHAAGKSEFDSVKVKAN